MQDLEVQFAAALSHQQAGRHAEAVEIYRALATQRVTVNLAHRLGYCLGEIGAFSEGRSWLELAASHRPDDPALLRHLAGVYRDSDEAALAEATYRRALAVAPGDAGVRLELAGLLLSQERYEEGWPLFEARLVTQSDLVPPIDLSFPEWRGEDLRGRSILVAIEQALGDQIQMARFAQVLKARGASHVTLACRPPLAPLFSGATGVDAVIPTAPNAVVSTPRHDVWCRYFSLPMRLDIRRETLPSAPYVFADPALRAAWGGRGRIGLGWQASPTGFNSRTKTLPDHFVERFLARGAISLQPQDTGATDLAQTAAIIEDLDLVISIDTSIAHLAGAMGKRCWTLLPFLRCDWRWGRGRSDSPWYPSMTLLRQTTPNGWDALVDEVMARLDAEGF